MSPAEPREWGWWIDPAADGAWNMEVDRRMAEEAARSGRGLLRFYAWNPATLSLGHFQRVEDRARHPSSLSCPLVRRPSGGGAIVHDRELTYALALPNRTGQWSDPRSAMSLFRSVHQALVETLSQFGVSAQLCDRDDDRRQRPPFLCFQRRAAGDVLAGSMKIAGSAQRRWAAALLQHGSVLLSQSPSAPELPGIAEIIGVQIDSANLANAWLAQLARRLGWQIPPIGSEPVRPVSPPFTIPRV